MAGGVVDPLPADVPFFVKDYYDYYKTKRGYHARSLNSNNGWAVIGNVSLMNSPLLQYSDEIRSAVMIMHKQRLIQSIQILNSGKNTGSVVDADQVMKYFVVHNFVSNDDGYTSRNVHNYYLYEKNGKMSMIPWDYNLAFGTMGDHGEAEVMNQSMDTLLTGEDVSTRPMFGWIVSNEKYKTQYHNYYAQFIKDQIDSGEITKLIDDTAAMLAPYIEKDPTKFYTKDTFETAVLTLKQYMELRSQKIKYVLSGSDQTVDTTGFNLVNLGAQDDESALLK